MKRQKLSELQAELHCCVFCTNTNKDSEGGYFKGKFVCESCADDFVDLAEYLE